MCVRVWVWVCEFVCMCMCMCVCFVSISVCLLQMLFVAVVVFVIVVVAVIVCCCCCFEMSEGIYIYMYVIYIYIYIYKIQVNLLAKWFMYKIFYICSLRNHHSRKMLMCVPQMQIHWTIASGRGSRWAGWRVTSLYINVYYIYGMYTHTHTISSFSFYVIYILYGYETH